MSVLNILKLLFIYFLSFHLWAAERGGEPGTGENDRASTPSYLSVPSSTVVDGKINISWAYNSSYSYGLQEQKNNGSWVALWSRGRGRTYNKTEVSDGLYRYRVQACTSRGCSSFKTSSLITVKRPGPIPPALPSSITTSNAKGSSTVSISWGTSSRATKYLLQEALPFSSFKTLTTTTARSYTRTGRVSGKHAYRVAGCDANGCGDFKSTAVTVKLKPATPPSITVPSATSTNGSIYVKWGYSTDSESYQLQESRNSAAWTTIKTITITRGVQREYTRTGRSSGSYKYRVRACNSSGCGSYRTSTVTKVLFKPTTPSSISVPSTSSGSIAISWGAAKDASKYTLIESRNGAAWSTISTGFTGRSYTRTNRSTGSYRYQVKGCNATGCSAYKLSAYTKVTTLPLLPSSITVPSAVSTNGTIAISWATSGGATKYTLQESRNGATWTTLTSSSTGRTYSRTGRSSGAYKYRARGCNVSGCSSYRISSTTTVLLKPLTPSSISVPSEISENGTIGISWAASTGATQYTLQESRDGATFTTLTSTTTAKSYSRTGRSTAGYQYRVRGCNSSGCSNYKVSSVIDVILPPPSPASINVSIDNQQGLIRVSWSRVGDLIEPVVPTGPGDAGLTEKQRDQQRENFRNSVTYRLEESINSGTWKEVQSIVNETSASSLARGNGSYKYRVKACNTSGCGPYRTASAVTLLLPPVTPSSISVPLESSKNGTIGISWAVSSGATKYTLQESRDGAAYTTLTSTTTARSYSRTGRSTAGYQYRVRGCNSSGCSNYKVSDVTYVSLPPPCPASINVSFDNHQGRIWVSWSRVGDLIEPVVPTGPGDAELTEKQKDQLRENIRNSVTYRLEESINSGTWKEVQSIVNETSASSLSRDNGSYKYRVKTCNTSGCGGYRTASAVTLLLRPEKPTGITATITDKGVASIHWDAVATATTYTLQQSVNEGNYKDLISGLKTNNFTYSGLLDGDIYSYQVKACNSSGCSIFRTLLDEITVYFPPQAPDEVTASANSFKEEIYLNWTRVGEEIVPFESTNTGGTQEEERRLAHERENIRRSVTYTIQERKNQTTWQFVTETENQTSITLTNRSVGAYQYRVMASIGASESEFTTSATYHITLNGSSTGGTVPGDTMTETAVPPNYTSTVGLMSGQGSVNGGAANYTLPISLPPGRNNIAPNVSLNYSSQSGNSVAGVGWSLLASSSIRRCANTVAQDGFNKGVNYTEADKLCYNGARLVETSDSLNGATRVYRTEIDQHILVKQYHELNSKNVTFEVLFKNNQRAFFGTTANSQVEHTGAAGHLEWKISQLSDASGNNTIDYVYDKFGHGEQLLTDIYYTGTAATQGDRQVKFIYEVNNDYRLAYLAGGKSETTQRLNSIKTFYNASLVKTYALTYSDSLATGRNLLRSVTECGVKSDIDYCLPSTSFDWQETETTYVVEPMQHEAGVDSYPLSKLNQEALPLITRYLPHGDTNGDGKRDWPGYGGAEENCLLSRSNHRLGCYEVDINLDGKTDIVKLVGQNDAQTSSPYLQESQELEISYVDGSWLKTGIILSSINPMQSNRAHDEILNIADFNGDGYADIVVYRASNSTPLAEIYLHTTNMSNPYIDAQIIHEYTFDSYSVVKTRLRFQGDITGDGLPDIIIDEVAGSLPTNTASRNFPTAVSQYIYINNSSPSTLIFEKTTELLNNVHDSNATVVNLFHDINGDGLADFINFAEGDFQYYLNKGNGEFTPIDYNGDNFAKRLTYYPGGGGGDPVAEMYSLKYKSQFRVMDIDGDGLPELLEPDTSRVVASGCTQLRDWTQRECDDSVYSQYDSQVYLPLTNNYIQDHTRSFGKQDYDVDLYLDGLYYFNVVKFSINPYTGAVDVTREPTDLIAHVSENAVVDTKGNGAADFIFAYTTRTSVNTIENATGEMSTYNNQYGIYINKATNAPDNGYQATDVLKAVHKGTEQNLYQWTFSPLSSDEFDNSNFIDSPTFYEPSDNQNLSTGTFNFASSMYVVAQYQQKNAIGTYNQTHYSYNGGAFDSFGRGMLGFEEIYEYNGAHKRLNITRYKQEFPLIGKVNNQSSYLYSEHGEPSILLTSTEYDWREYGTEVENTGVYLYTVNKNSYDESSISLGDQISTASAIDSCGNITSKSIVKSDTFGTYQTDTSASYDCDSNNWWLNKLTQNTVTQHAVTGRSGLQLTGNNSDLDSTYTISTTFDDWDDNHRIAKRIIVTGSSADIIDETVTKNVIYNDYGLATSESSTTRSYSLSDTVQNSTRTHSITYTNTGTSVADDGYFPYQMTNDRNQVMTVHTAPTTGQSVQVTDVADIVIYSGYDAFGRLLSKKQGNLATQQYAYNDISSDPGAPEHATYVLEVTQSATPTSRQYYNLAGQVIKSSQQGFDGDYIHQLNRYNARGFKVFESLPYPESTSDINANGKQWFEFDALGRPAKASVPTSSSFRETYYSYDGHKVDISTDGLNMSRQFNSLQQLMQTTDALKGTTRYAYNAAGSPIAIEDAADNIIYAKYDSLQRKKWVNDPNQGLTTFVYNGFGELAKQVDANNNTQRFIYDGLGRVLQRQETLNGSAVMANFVWDTNQVGQLTSQSTAGVNKQYKYNTELGAVKEVITVIDNQTYSYSHQFDGYGRVKATVYPNQLTVGFTYNDYGYLTTEYNAASKYEYRRINAQDHWGNITNASLANQALTETHRYDDNTGQLNLVETLRQQVKLQSIGYSEYDSFGNLKLQENYLTNSEESFHYDALHRLENSNQYYNSLSKTIDYTFDATGNLLSKSDFANVYEYKYAQPNAVSAVTLLNNNKISYGYDNRGNQTSGKGTITYNVHDKPLSIITAQGQTQFSYGADLQRFKQSRSVDGTTVLTHYIDKLYEVDFEDGESYARAFIGDIAIVGNSKERGTYVNFLHGDRLGSIATITDHNGQVLSTRSYDPFGKPRTGSFQEGSVAQLSVIDGGSALTRRGFTQHEHIDEMELIHMNGRVYDYNLGRFLSVDPFIQDPGNSQSLNPYSYIMNNPLAGTDPTGYKSETVEMKDDDKLIKMDDGNTYLDQGGDSLIKVDSVTATSSNGSSTTVNMGSSGSTSDIGSQNNVAQNDSQSSQSSQSFGDGLKSGIQSQASNMARKTGQELGVGEDDQGDGVNAEWGNVNRDESGNITQASVVCGMSCRAEAGLYSYKHSMDLIRIRNQNDYGSLANQALYKIAEYSSYGFIGAEVLAASAAKWAFMKASDKIAYFMIVGDGATLGTGGAGAVISDTIYLGLYQNARTQIPRMTLKSTKGKPVVRNGKFVVD